MQSFDFPSTSPATTDHQEAHDLQFEEVYLALHSELVAYARRLTHSRPHAEDVVQEAVERALRAWPTWKAYGDPMDHARAWLYRIIGNQFVTGYHRDRKLANAMSDYTEEIVAETFGRSTPIASTETCTSVDLSDEVRDAVASLPPHQREVIEKVYFGTMSPEEAAIDLGVPKGTVFSRLSRARTTLARALKHYAGENYNFSRLAKLRGAGVDALETSEGVQTDTSSVDSVMAADDGAALEHAETTPDKLTSR